MFNLKNKKVSVIGLGKRTGLATVKELYKLGAKIIVSDIKGPDELQEELSLLKDYKDIEFDLNGHSEKSLKSDLIIVSPGVPLENSFFKKAEKLGIPYISEIELAYHLNKAKIVAITGTNGKTTTTSILGNILMNSDIGRVKVGGNIGAPLIQEIDGLEENDWVVVELSSFQLETIRVFRPEISIYLNFSPDHIDRHKSIENYWNAKKRIFMNQLDHDYAIVNYDDSEVMKAVKDCKARILGVSMKNEGGSGIYLKNNELILNIDNKKETILNVNDISLKGIHNIQNVAFAILASYIIGVKKKDIIYGINTFIPAQHRMEELDPVKDVLIVDDSKATNPDAAIKAINSYNRPIILIAGGQDRDANFAELAIIIKQRVKYLILLGETKDKIELEVLKTGFTNIYKVKNMKEAVNTAYKIFKPGYCLLLSPACPSWDMYLSYEERGNDFRKQVNILRGK
jgi:UDP-N-acetylmuramoylalanine--D-glutamate ligase